MSNVPQVAWCMNSTHTIIGPSFGTFSSPTTRTSVKNELAAAPAIPRMIRCNSMKSEEAMLTVVVVDVKDAAVLATRRIELGQSPQRSP